MANLRKQADMDEDMRRERSRRLQREAQARYAARKRGEDVPLRRPGPHHWPLQKRFDLKVIVVASGCWEWAGSHDSHGYPRIREDGRTTGAHRVAYRLYIGPIPDGYVIDHLCRNPGCVNPEHLEAVTQLTNFLRGEHRSAVTARENRCQRGHEFTPENTIIIVKRCKACVKAGIQERRDASR